MIREARKLGYDTNLYQQVESDKAEQKVLGQYVQMANQLFEQRKISAGKYEELMLDGFRADIIYGDEGDEQSGD